MELQHKNRYDTEAAARNMGRQYARRAGIELYVYRSAECLGWFLTSTERAPYWNVMYVSPPNDDFTDITTDPYLWDRLFEMPDMEAEVMLRSLRRQTIDQIAYFEGRDKQHVFRLNSLLRRLNDEFHFVAQRINNTNWAAAVRRLYGDEGYEQVRLEMMHLQETSAIEAGNHKLVLQMRSNADRRKSV